ncbi:MAG: type II toxin-antitoxin system Phd/YefM family antitoxin [Eubacterium sp.]|jgi:PHD/YefM family antitoxin component YafN of YafNO toxin-antitoxin module|uniref:type II toxin-antitoxin system Phd/YefM family antitoxin n=1 Tax=Eubacterium sp. F2 TaxID=3381348 RepID=UPI0039082561|nr:type II toxin-antitoxin system Phd/YefM family antitoxin [Eubacterium sp.]MCI2197706.1 type II toxin-antitoxin system Phd/YefM family antitoxin [Eubacterium sp.]
MPEIVPIKELRNTNEISRRCHESQEPIFVTKQGYGDLVVMSMETYDRLTGIADVDQSIKHAEEELAAGGQLRDAESALKELRRKHFG